MKHFTSPEFWAKYKGLPAIIQQLADRAFQLVKNNPTHPSLQFKKVGQFWSARVGLHHKALAVNVSKGVLWFWIGTHAEYDRILG